MASPFRLPSAVAALVLAFPMPGAPSAQEILAAADAHRNPPAPFQATIDLVEYRNRQGKESSRLRIYARPDAAKGRYDCLARFLEPARDRDKLILSAEGEIWFHDRAGGGTVRISAQQRLLGQASNGDVLTMNLASDFTATNEGAETVLDGDRKERACLRLALVPSRAGAPYHRIELWVDKASHRPVKARFHAPSGRLLKTVFYRCYEHHLGADRPTEVVIIDGLDADWITVMRFSAFRRRDLPDAWFRRDGLHAFRD